MSLALTTAGEELIARLFADGAPLVIDRFLFAYIEGQDHTAPVDPGAGVPLDKLVHEAIIPDEYRAFINPNQVVYSALIGSDIGDFFLNWQGLYCSEHDVLVAVQTFKTLESRTYDESTNTAGNNLTRNFLLEFTGAQRLTGITIEAKVWQLDFTVRLKGIDERERLSNRDIYGRAAFLEDGWKLVEDEGRYYLLPGAGYVEGIRIGLTDRLEIFPDMVPCDVWLDVCMEPEGSDVVAKARILYLAPGEARPDYMTPAPYRIPHYLEKIAHIGKEPESVRPSSPGQTFFGLGLAPDGCLQVRLMRDIEAFRSRKRRCALLLAALTFVRPGELCSAEWSEIEFDTAVWRIPAVKMKMKRPHLVPLSRQAQEVLRELRNLNGENRWLFPSRWDRTKHQSGRVLNTALRRVGYSPEVMTAHGFRAMAATVLSEQGWPSEVIERQLAHVDKNAVRAAYQRSDLLEERRKMLQAWADYLDMRCAWAILGR